MVLISLYSKLSGVGGAQKMCLSIHQGLVDRMKIKEDYVCSQSYFENIDNSYIKQIKVDKYLRFNAMKLLFKFDNAIFISHHRKLTTQLVFWSRVLRRPLKIIHVAHNEFYSFSKISLFPKHVIAVSEGVKKNHQEVFGLKEVKVIYNGINTDYSGKQNKEYSPEVIKILIPGRITKVKQQLKLVTYLYDKLPKNIKFIFAGKGEDYIDLLKATKNNSQFECVGHVNNMESLYLKADYVMLFSKQEGLPLSLIEGLSYGLPVLCNDVGGNLEILKKGYNGFLLNSLDAIPSVLENLGALDEKTYNRLSKNSRKSFVNNFNYDMMVSNYLNYIGSNVQD